METLEELSRKINNVRELQSVVRTMKILAMVNVRQFERAVESLDDYRRTIELGLRMLLRERPEDAGPLRVDTGRRLGAVVFGSEQGLAGQFNDLLAAFALAKLDETGIPPEGWNVLALGDRVAPLIGERQTVEEQLPFPNSLAGIPDTLREVLTVIERWRVDRGIERVLLFHNRPLSGASYRSEMVHLLPVDEDWLRSLEEREWTSRTLPMYTMEWKRLFTALIGQHLRIGLFRAFVDSLAAENASRLAAMQAAERNIGDHLEELGREFNQQRQNSITAELLDIIAGYEALGSGTW